MVKKINFDYIKKSPSKEDRDLHLEGLLGHGALGNAQKVCQRQQGALHSPARARERGYSTEKPHRQVVKALLQELDWEILQHPPYSPDLPRITIFSFPCPYI